MSYLCVLGSFLYIFLSTNGLLLFINASKIAQILLKFSSAGKIFAFEWKRPFEIEAL